MRRVAFEVTAGERGSARRDVEHRNAVARSQSYETARGLTASEPVADIATEVEATSILSSLNVKTARSWRGIIAFTHLAREGAYDSHHRTAGIAGRTRRPVAGATARPGR